MSLVASVELLELAGDGAALQGLRQQQHALLQGRQLRHPTLSLQTNEGSVTIMGHQLRHPALSLQTNEGSVTIMGHQL